MKKIFLLGFFLNFFISGYSQETFTIESPDPSGKANLDLLSLNKAASGMEAVWLYRPVANVMCEGEEERKGKIYKKSPNTCTGESHMVDGKTISECDEDKSIAYATSLYVIIKQNLSLQGKNLGTTSVVPVALRYFKNGTKYTAEFPEALPFFSTQKINVDYNIANINQCNSLSASEKSLLTNIFIKQHMFVYNLGSIADPADPYEQLVSELSSMKDMFSGGPKIPENQAFKYNYEIGSQKFMLTKDKRYKNEKGSVYYVYDVTENRSPVLIDSTFSADEGELNEKIFVVDRKMKPCGMLFNYTIIKYLPNKDEEYSRQVIYVGADKKVIKSYFKTGHSRGGPLSSCGIKYAIKYGDTIFFESSSKRKKLPELIESFVLTKEGIQKTTPADTSKPFLKEATQRIGNGCFQDVFTNGDNNLNAIAQYNDKNINVVFYQAKEVPIPNSTPGTFAPKNYGISSVSVFKNYSLMGTARFYYPYNSNKPLHASFAYGNEKIKLFVLPFDNIKTLISINTTSGEIKSLELNDAKSGFTHYQTLDKKQFCELDNQIMMTQKNSSTKQFRIVKIL